MSNILDVGQSTAGAAAASEKADVAAVNAVDILVDARAIPSLQRKQRLIDVYLFLVDACLKSGVSDWWRHAGSLPFTDIAQGVDQVKELCLHGVLHDAGDIATACRAYELLEQDGYLAEGGDDQFLLDLLRFLRPLIKTEVQSNRGAFGYFKKKKMPRALVSLIVPDEQSLAHLRELCLPSLDSDGALAWLCGFRDVTLMISGRESHLDELKALLRETLPHGQVTATAFPDLLGDRLAGGELRRDWLVGSMQWQHLTEARRLNADYLSIDPSGIYAAGYLRKVLKGAEEASAILTVPLWIDNRGLLDRTMGRIRPSDPAVISTQDLVSLARDVVAPTGSSIFIEGNTKLRGETAHLMALSIDAGCLEIHSTRHEIAFLASDRVRMLPQRFFLRPGADMERILASGATPHFVTLEDDIGVAIFGHPPGTLVDVAGDAASFDALIEPLAERRHSLFFQRPVRLQVSSNAEPESGGRKVQGFGKLLLTAGATTPRFRVNQILAGLSILHQYEMSEYGPSNMADGIAEGRRLLDLSPGDESAFSEVERKALIRAAMNFDYVDKALALAKEGGEATSFVNEFLSRMMELREENIQWAHQIRRRFFYRRSFAVLGSIVWGDAFVDRFVKYHIPSLLAEGNIPALKRSRKVIHSIVTTEADRARIIASPAFGELKKHAEILFTCFPERLLADRERAQYPFYHFYGLLDHQNVFLAAALGAELYLLPPDIVVSHDSLSNLARRLRRGAACCSIAGVESDPDVLRQWLDSRPRGPAGQLDLPPQELLDFAVAKPDAYARSLIMNKENAAFCVHPRELTWPHPNGLSVHSIFMHPVAVSARLMARPFAPQYENVDYALLPRLLQGDAELEVLADAREMVIAQFGAPASREEFLDSGFSIEAFVEVHRYNYAAHRRCFPKRQFFAAAAPPYSASESYDAEVVLIQEALKRYRFSLVDDDAAS